MKMNQATVHITTTNSWKQISKTHEYNENSWTFLTVNKSFNPVHEVTKSCTLWCLIMANVYFNSKRWAFLDKNRQIIRLSNLSLDWPFQL